MNRSGPTLKLTIELSEAHQRQLAELAARLGEPTEALAGAAVRQWVGSSFAEFN